MAAEWFYEYDGTKTGPVPSDTIRHLAKHGAISPTTRMWRDDMNKPFEAHRVKNLFAVSSNTVRQPNETVTQYLTEVLNACRDEDDERLERHTPTLMAIHPFSVSGILLDFEIGEITKLPTPLHDPTLMPGEQTKPVRQLFNAVVTVAICDRPNYGAPLEEIRDLQPGRRTETIVYECKEFQDGDWIFLDSELTK